VETALPTTESALVSSSLAQVIFTDDPTAVSISVIYLKLVVVVRSVDSGDDGVERL
jgi:hypothetical protein